MNLDLFDNVSVSKLSIDNNDIYIKILWKDDETVFFNITVYEDKVWTGVFSHESAEISRSVTQVTREEYLSNVKTALTTFNDMFAYDFTTNTDCTEAVFKWKKKFPDSSATLRYGVVTLQLDTNTESKNSLIDFLLNCNSFHIVNNKEHVETMKKLSAELETCKMELKKYCDIKESIEKVLYGKFVEVLNEKKKRIQLLEEKLRNNSEYIS